MAPARPRPLRSGGGSCAGGHGRLRRRGNRERLLCRRHRGRRCLGARALLGLGARSLRLGARPLGLGADTLVGLAARLLSRRLGVRLGALLGLDPGPFGFLADPLVRLGLSPALRLGAKPLGFLGLHVQAVGC